MQFIVANAVPKNIKIPNKVTEIIYSHCKAAASIMRATVLSVVSYTHASPSGYQRGRSGMQPVPILTRVSMLSWLASFVVEHTETMHCYSLRIFSGDTTYKALSVLQFHVQHFQRPDYDTITI